MRPLLGPFIQHEYRGFHCRGMYSSSNICFDGCTAEQLFQHDLMPSKSDEVDAFVTLCKDSENIKMLSKNACYSTYGASSSLTCASQLDLKAPRDSEQFSKRWNQASASSSCSQHDWNLSNDHQVKRARVENIIKCMTSSPDVNNTDVIINQSGAMQVDESIQELTSPQENHGFGSPGLIQMTRTQLERQNKHLRQLRTSFKHGSRKSPKYPNWNDEKFWDAGKDSYKCKSSSGKKDQGLKKGKLMKNIPSKPEQVKLMADVLKYELSRVVTKSVDSILKSMPLLHVLPYDEGGMKTDGTFHSSVCNDDNVKVSCGNAEDQVPETQTEVLSLVTRQPPSRLRSHHPPKPLTFFSHDFILRDGELSEENHSSAAHHAFRCFQSGCSEIQRANLETFDTHWNSVQVRSKLNSRSVRSPHTQGVLVDPMVLQDLRLPRVKVESDKLVKNDLYVLNEGLTTNHLKKAKLMFFYTRYPSSLVLKRCFHDVQFTRCITSQLIKWFSNFREFYYIQMEKSARHAVVEGAPDVRGLTVGRQSQLFRALNMHYNKANDFQVPDRFLEVAEITLREFYVAISAGKDHDPSWKKAIYKVICKLDSDVPDEFRNHLSG
ncbi:prospero homeobox protein 1-like [Antennarius striatus]|uniref:prospero homeobox protein 1-like n=1 Tax=Antennarius striatus TaxID=241820 RepID=UPI0035B22CD8